MSTTSLKLPDTLKLRTVAAARRAGKTPHAFMVEAIEQAASAAELRAQFSSDAARARKTTIKTGRGYTAEDVHAYLRDRIVGKKAPRPKAKVWRD